MKAIKKTVARRVHLVPGTRNYILVTMSRHTGAGGRPSKGERYAAKTRLPLPVADAVWAEAEQTGMPVSDVIARYVALGTGLVEYAPRPPSARQEPLPIKMTA